MPIAAKFDGALAPEVRKVMNADGSHYKVSVVLDRTFGDRLSTLLKDGPVWIVDSPANRAAADICWRENPVSSHLEGVTLFTAYDTTPPEETLVGNLSTIDLHHGEYSAPTPYSILEVIGTPRTPTIEVSFGDYGFQNFEDTKDGFRATRELSRPVL